MLLAALVYSSTPPPFTLSLDQSPPCPRAINDAWLRQSSSSPAPIAPNATAELEAAIAAVPALLQQSMKQLNAPSASLVAIQNGATLFEEFAGTARLHQQVPPTKDDGFLIASNSKVFTSVMLHQLRDRGVLPAGLDTEVASIFPGWIEPKPAPGASTSKRRLTLRSLAMHASGLPREWPLGSKTHTEAEILASIGNASLQFPMYAHTAYSNLGLSLLGRTLEKVAGKTWEAWMVDEIMAPLGMSNSGPCLRTAADKASIIDGVDPATGLKIPLSYTNSSKCKWGAPCGDIFSTPADMLKWASFLSGQTEHAAVLDPATVREMRNTMFVQPDGIGGISGATFESAHSHGRWTFNKLGCLGGYRSSLTLVPSLGLGLFADVASTCDLYGDGDALGFPAASKLIPALEGALAARFDASRRVAAADEYTGKYCALGSASIAADADGKLTVENGPMGHGYRWELLPTATGKDTYRLLMQPMPASLPGCSSADWPTTESLCQPSCFREMGRGDGVVMTFERNSSGKVSGFVAPAIDFRCGKVA